MKSQSCGLVERNVERGISFQNEKVTCRVGSPPVVYFSSLHSSSRAPAPTIDRHVIGSVEHRNLAIECDIRRGLHTDNKVFECVRLKWQQSENSCWPATPHPPDRRGEAEPPTEGNRPRCHILQPQGEDSPRARVRQHKCGSGVDDEKRRNGPDDQEE